MWGGARYGRAGKPNHRCQARRPNLRALRPFAAIPFPLLATPELPEYGETGHHRRCMVSPQERNLIITIFLVLALGAVVKSCRNRVTVTEFPKSKESVIQVSPPVEDGQD